MPRRPTKQARGGEYYQIKSALRQLSAPQLRDLLEATESRLRTQGRTEGEKVSWLWAALARLSEPQLRDLLETGEIQLRARQRGIMTVGRLIAALASFPADWEVTVTDGHEARGYRGEFVIAEFEGTVDIGIGGFEEET